MNTPELVAVAALCMIATDVVATIEVQSEADNRGVIAGALDTVGWLVSIATTTISLNAIDGHDTTRKILVIVFVSAANFFGTWLGVGWGAKLLRRQPTRGGPLTEAISRRASRDNGLKP